MSASALSTDQPAIRLCRSSLVPRAAYQKQTPHDPLQNGSTRKLSITLNYHQSPLTATAE